MTTDTSFPARAQLPAGRKQSVVKATLLVVLASIGLFPHFILSAAFGPVGYISLVLVTVGALIVSFEFAYALLIVCLFLQNLFIAIVTPLAPDVDQFTPMLGTSFVNILLTSFVGAVIWLKARRGLPEDNNSLLRSLVLFFVTIVIYTGVGAVHASLTDALIYARVYLVGGLLLIAGIAFGFRLTPAYAINVLRIMALFLAIWGVLEFFFTYEMYSIFHIADYIHFKYSTSLFTDVNNVEEAINFSNRAYLNLSGMLGLKFDVLRPQGPNVHPISYAYALAFSVIVCYVNRSNFLAAACFALLILVGAKGPILMAFLALVLGAFYQTTRNHRWLSTALLASMIIYTAIGLAYGIYTEDYHVVGFLGGVKGFLANPLGYGVGVGGNLSTLTAEKVNFSLFQNYGASFALESGFGVMLYQIGIGTVFFLLFYWRLWHSVWKAALYFSAEPRLIAIPCALAILLVNSIFQEEAFSPVGWGPLMLLSGLLLARYWRRTDFDMASNI